MSGYFQTPAIPTLSAKAPYDKADWKLDFTNTLSLVPGDTIASIVSVTPAPSGITIGTTGIVAGIGGAALAVGVVISGGSVGVFYTITADIIATSGNQFSRSIIVPVQNR